MSNRRQPQRPAETQTTDGVASVLLRPEAPVFVPSWCKGDRKGPKPLIKGTTDTKKKNQRKGDHKPFTNGPQKMEDRDRDHGRRRQSRSETTDFPTLDRPTVCANHRRRQRRKERVNQIDRSRIIRQQADVGENPAKGNDAQGLLLSSFPALLPARTTAHEISTTWSQTPNISPSVDVTSQNPKAPLKSSNEDDGNIFQKLGLVTLQATTMSKNEDAHLFSSSARRRFSEFAEWDDADEIIAAIPIIEDGLKDTLEWSVAPDNESRQTSGTAASLSFNRSKINMNRLRDRWWDALARRRKQKEFLTELSRTLKPYRVEAVQLKAATSDVDLEDDSQSLSDEASIASGYKVEDSVVATNEEKHVKNHRPLDEIIKQNDEVDLLQLLKNPSRFSSTSDRSQQMNTIIRLAVLYDKPNMLRMVLSYSEPNVVVDNEHCIVSLLHATELGFEECVAVLFSKQGRCSTNDLLYRDNFGNNILHWCCRGSAKLSLLHFILNNIPGGGKGKQHLLSKMMLTRNHERQTTPFHEACCSGKVSFVEVFLDVCSSSLLSKVLFSEDINHQTPLLTAITSNAADVVTALIMWRYNRNSFTHGAPNTFSNEQLSSGRSGYMKPKQSTNQMCPLIWAAKIGNVDMIDLLLQFGDQSGSSYRPTEALHSLLRSKASIEEKTEGSELLIGVGANPFEECSVQLSEICSALTIALESGSGPLLRSVISCGKACLQHLQTSRRRDPKLRLLPDAFFRVLESKEDAEMNSCITSALLQALARAQLTQSASDLCLVDVLYEFDIKVDMGDLGRLRTAIDTSVLPLQPPPSSERCIVAVYDLFTVIPEPESRSVLKKVDPNRTPLEWNSWYLLELFPTILDGGICKCPCLSACSFDKKEQPRLWDNEIIVISQEGTRFKVHEHILARKSEKFKSAIRFNRMNWGDGAPGTILELHVPIPATLFQAMIQHLYHGSLFLWRPCNKTELCQFLLELMLIAEEYLCTDLVQEIEMRLLSSDPQRCFCWSCARAVRAHPSQAFAVQCLYSVDVAGSLLAGTNVFDVLGVTEFIGAPSFSVSLLPRAVARGEDTNFLWNCSRDKSALVVLRDCLELQVLRSFSSLRWIIAESSKNCYEGTEVVISDIDSQKRDLLQMCLNNISTNTLLDPFDSGSTGRAPRRSFKSEHDGVPNIDNFS